MFPFTHPANCGIIRKEHSFAEVGMNKFVLKAPYKPSGDQPEAIEALARGVMEGMD